MYTPEDVPSLLFRPVFTLAGWVSGLTGLSDQIVYQLFRMAGSDSSSST
jgi:hypothetical protein